MTTQLITKLSQWSGLHIIDVERIVRSGPRRYKVFSIPKRNGGLRVVAQPSRELKALQRFVVNRILNEIPVHDAAHGYVRGRGIKSNAAAHVTARYLLKMDLEDFFPSLRPLDLGHLFRRVAPELLDQDERKQLYNILFWRPKRLGLRLCIGAPSSPFISNVLMFDLDMAICEICRRYGVVYTRYADDMTFSSVEKGTLSVVQSEVQALFEKSRSPRLRVNHDKTVHISRAQRVVVTGVTINTAGQLSIGRERKRLIRAMVHRSTHGDLNEDEEAELEGLLAFANDIESAFTAKMRGLRGFKK